MKLFTKLFKYSNKKKYYKGKAVLSNAYKLHEGTSKQRKNYKVRGV